MGSYGSKRLAGRSLRGCGSRRRSRGGRPRRSGSRGNLLRRGGSGASNSRVGRRRRARSRAGSTPSSSGGRWWPPPRPRRRRTLTGSSCLGRGGSRGTLDGVGSARPRPGRLVDGLVGGLAVEHRRQPGDQSEPSALAGSVGGIGGFRRSRVEPAQVPPDQAEHQDARRGEQHQRETLDQRVATVDHQVFDTGEFGAVEQEVGAGHRTEQDQRWLDDRGENSGLANGQQRGHATRHIQAGEDGGQLLAGAGVESEADSDPGHGDHHCGPPRHTRNSGDYRAVICGHRRPVLLF